MADEKIERIERVYTVPLGKAYEYVRTKRARRAISLLKAFVARHMKTYLGSVKLSEALNEAVWARSMQKPPRKIKIKIVKEGEIAKASLLDEKPKPKRKVKEAKKEADKKEETKKEESKKEEPKKEEKKKDSVPSEKTGETKK